MATEALPKGIWTFNEWLRSPAPKAPFDPMKYNYSVSCQVIEHNKISNKLLRTKMYILGGNASQDRTMKKKIRNSFHFKLGGEKRRLGGEKRLEIHTCKPQSTFNILSLKNI